MKELYIVRVSENKDATFGVFVKSDGTPFAVTLEKPWRDNKRGESCIPLGTYTCLRCSKSKDYNYQPSPKFGDTFQVIDVPNRLFILFHKLNIARQTHGCIGIGEKFDPVMGSDGITESTQGYEEFMYFLRNEDSFKLNIVKESLDSYFFARGST